MSVAYRTVQWNRHKVVYDLLLWAAILAFLGAFVLAGSLTHSGDHAVSPPILLLRGLAAAAFVLLHLVLSIGPLARVTPLAAPLLYNRRHLGVSVFLLGLAHAVLAIGFYGGFGDRLPLLALLDPPGASWASVSAFPFELLGFIALVILFLLAATSHDFWLKNLSARAWKALHMLVYPAYALLVGHVALGAMQAERSPLIPIALLAGALWLTGIHLLAALRERRRQREAAVEGSRDGWAVAAPVAALEDGRARLVVLPGGARVALVRSGDEVSALSNVCAHQGGPLSEGRVIDGCLTCPWHGYQYLPGTGCSPPPYTERVVTHEVRIEGGDVLVRIEARAAGDAADSASLPVGAANA